MHIYLQVITLLLSTVVLILGWFAVGPERSLTNPHHGIGVAIYTLVWVQAISGSWVRRWKKRNAGRRLSLKQMLHQWLGRATALLGIAQVALGLTLYGSPKYTFVLYAVWMAFLLFLYFLLSYRLAGRPVDEMMVSNYEGRPSGPIIQEKKSGFLSYLAPVLAGAGAAALLGRKRNRSRSRDRTEYTESRRGSRRGSAISLRRDSYDEKRQKKGGIMDKVIAGAAVLGVGAMAKNYFDKRKARRDDDEYSAVAPDTPSRRSGRRPVYEEPSEFSEDSHDVRRADIHRGPLLPGPGNPAMAAAAISAAEPRPQTPRPVTPRASRRSRRDSYSDEYDSEYDDSPSRSKTGGHAVRNGLLGGLGLAWVGNKFKQRRDRKEQQRFDDIRRAEREEERRVEDERRRGSVPPRYTGDGVPARGGRRTQMVESDLTGSSDLSSVLDPPPRTSRTHGPSSLGPSGSRHEVSDVPMPTVQARPSRTDYSESESEVMGRRTSRRRREEAAAAAATGTAAALAAEERNTESRHERNSSRPDVQSPPVSLHVTQHHDRDRNVTLRRLTEEEAAAARRERKRAGSVGSMSASDASRGGRYRRDESRRRAERRAEAEVEANTGLEPPRPAFAGGRKAGDSTYYSGTPARPSNTDLSSPGSHGTWSAMSPSSAIIPPGADEDAAERRRRRRAERNQRQTGTVEFT